MEQIGDANNNITYSGCQYDKETDLYYLNARYYDSKIARFINEDTLLYLYSPPTGQSREEIHAQFYCRQKYKNKVTFGLFNPNYHSCVY